jgi:hypothetical protein
MPLDHLAIYCNWSAYDELSDPSATVELTEELAMRQFDELLRLRSLGVRFDAYLMDCFWYAPDGGYRTWRSPHFPSGGDRWLAACRRAGLIPGLWFGCNSLALSRVADPAWASSLSADGSRASLSAGPFLAHLIETMEMWAGRGVGLFKLDFADLGAGTPAQLATLLPSELRAANATALRTALAGFRRTHPGCRVIAYNGLEERYLQGGTADWGLRSLSTAWMDAFDSVYTGDPRPADLPMADFWRSKDAYSDHLVRCYHDQGWPLARLDNAGFMIGTTATCLGRGLAGWKAMLALSLARGGRIHTAYGNLDLIDAAAAAWWARIQSLYLRRQAHGRTSALGGIPGRGEAYGWSSVVGRDGLWTVVNPGQAPATLRLPGGAGATVGYADGPCRPRVVATQDDALVELAPEQMAVLGRGEDAVDLGDDLAPSRPSRLIPLEAAVERAVSGPFQPGNRLVARLDDPPEGTLRIVVRQTRGGHPVRSCGRHHGWGLLPHDRMITIAAEQYGGQLEVLREDHRPGWSGLSWAVGRIRVRAGAPLRLAIASAEPAPLDLELCVLVEAAD